MGLFLTMELQTWSVVCYNVVFAVELQTFKMVRGFNAKFVVTDGTKVWSWPIVTTISEWLLYH